MSRPITKHDLRDILCQAIRAKHSSMVDFVCFHSLITKSICVSTRTLPLMSFHCCLLLPECRADKIQESHRIGVRQTQQPTLLVRQCFMLPSVQRNRAKSSYLLTGSLKNRNLLLLPYKYPQFFSPQHLIYTHTTHFYSNNNNSWMLPKYEVFVLFGVWDRVYVDRFG